MTRGDTNTELIAVSITIKMRFSKVLGFLRTKKDGFYYYDGRSGAPIVGVDRTLTQSYNFDFDDFKSRIGDSNTVLIIENEYKLLFDKTTNEFSICRIGGNNKTIKVKEIFDRCGSITPELKASMWIRTICDQYSFHVSKKIAYVYKGIYDDDDEEENDEDDNPH